MHSYVLEKLIMFLGSIKRTKATLNLEVEHILIKIISLTFKIIANKTLNHFIFVLLNIVAQLVIELNPLS